MEPTCCSKQFFFSMAGEIQAVAFLLGPAGDLPLMETTTGAAIVFVPLPRAVYSYGR